jgi:hypothetical protein
MSKTFMCGSTLSASAAGGKGKAFALDVTVNAVNAADQLLVAKKLLQQKQQRLGGSKTENDDVNDNPRWSGLPAGRDQAEPAAG